MGTLNVTTLKGNSIQQNTVSGLSNEYASTAYFMTRLTANSNPNDSASFTLRTVFNTTASLNVGGFTTDGNYIYVPENGLYIVSANVAYNNAAARDVPGFRFSINGNGQIENSLSSYIRVGSGHNEASTELVTAYQLLAGDSISMQFRLFGNTGTNTTIIASYSYINVWRLGS